MFDRTHEYAGLALVAPAQTVPEQELARTMMAVIAAINKMGRPEPDVAKKDLRVGSVVVHHVVGTDGTHYFVWRWPDGVIGCVITMRPDLTQRFLTQYLKAQPST